jgi:hypothetical protein
MASKNKWKKLFFNIPMESIDTIDEAMKMARKIWESESDGYQLTMICQHFLTFSSDHGPKVIADMFAKLERDSGLKIIAVDTKRDKIVYGRQHIDALDGAGGDDESQQGASGGGDAVGDGGTGPDGGPDGAPPGS